MSSPFKTPTPAYRLVDLGCLDTLLQRGSLDAPSCVPKDGQPYPSIHDTTVREKRAAREVPIAPGGTVDDYVSFYFGQRGPMLYRLHTGTVPSFTGSQDQLIYLAVLVQAVDSKRIPFVFTDGHSLASFTEWFHRLDQLDQVDWDAVAQKYWNNTLDDQDLQRRKQAELLVHRRLPWDLIAGIVTASPTAQAKVEHILARHPKMHHPRVIARPSSYYN